MAFLTATTKGGSEWTPAFVEEIDHEKCIGCGRCFKACARKVLGPEDLIDEESDSIRMVMSVVNGDNCSGCAACASTCPKGCFTLKPLEA
ncbi:ferredoxin III, nif-specific [Geothermobacter hydrogeniphilus]|uniref:Ferredoxin III n=1 Tax=Geothermobacter hydrogeniphilus TaxID=1969733 RepID=A0A2K2H6K4_9BACT|nr:ferredoxin III, nif-specific [Geothermobacter hydrogeniphilus]PNU18944.1 ferredoxin III, nif-specific [Geothermobacter hydrogeniphilus]